MVLITPGDESGSWGGTTNANLSRIDEAMSAYYSINVDDPPSGSAWDAASNTMTWILTDGITARTDGSEGRGKYIKFTNTGGGSAPDDFPRQWGHNPGC